MIEKILILIVIVVHIAIAQLPREQSIYKSNGTALQCIIDARDNSTCIYTDINDPIELIRRLPDVGNPQATFIKKLKFYKCYIDNFYSNLFALFPNLTEVQASGQYLTRLDRKDIGATESLLKLNISYNRIHRLTGEATSGAIYLENLDISHNILERITSDAFKYNVNLKYLNMSHNQIVSLDRQFFDSVRSAYILKLNNNKITDITGNFEHFVSAFYELHLQNNFLVTVDPQLLVQPSYVDLSLNSIVNLDLNRARTIELKIMANQLQTLSIGRKLQKLDASENRLYMFKINVNSVGTNLTHLNLSYIKYSMKDEKLLIDFRKFDKLQVLDLSDNNLINFDITDLAYGVSRTIQKINFENAHLRMLKNWEKIKFLLPNLHEINLLDNIFDCDELERMISQISKLNISLPGFNPENNETFISRSCSRFPHNFEPPTKSLIREEHTFLIWCFVAIFLIGFTTTGLVFINKKLSVFEKLYDTLKVNPYKPRGSKLLDEEKTNDTENSF